MDIFYVRLMLSFIVGATWITTATILAEKYGSKIGGVITGIPSTTVLSLFFIGLTQSPAFAVKSVVAIPVVLGVDALFSAVYILLSKRSFVTSIAIPLVIWFILSFFVVLSELSNLGLSLILFGVLYASSIFVVGKRTDVRSQGSRKMTYSFGQILFRACLSGSIIAGAVVASRLGGPILGGVFASFPAIMLSTMIITRLSHGKDFSSAIMKVLMISGGLNVVIYALAVELLYPSLGLYVGTAAAFSVSLITSYLTYRFIQNRIG
ncbi:MAG TPA: DUF3147 family protein [Patescibacteria group bacterium]|nr:DUF3147 family protein [Patescibacteria group bacterium]